HGLQLPWNLAVQSGSVRNHLLGDALLSRQGLAVLLRLSGLGRDAADQSDMRMRHLRRYPPNLRPPHPRSRRDLLLVPEGAAAPRLPAAPAWSCTAAVRQ